MISQFERDGIAKVKASIESQNFGSEYKRTMALEWLNGQSENREISREKREEDSLGISRKALCSSRLANFIAVIAVLIVLFSLFYKG